MLVPNLFWLYEVLIDFMRFNYQFLFCTLFLNFRTFVHITCSILFQHVGGHEELTYRWLRQMSKLFWQRFALGCCLFYEKNMYFLMYARWQGRMWFLKLAGFILITPSNNLSFLQFYDLIYEHYFGFSHFVLYVVFVWTGNSVSLLPNF